MRMNSNLYTALWFDNGKKLTLVSLIYMALGFGCLLAGSEIVAMLVLVMAELNRVDKDQRILGIEQTEAILYEGDHPEEFDKDDDHDK
jgi:hypothetical protein